MWLDVSTVESYFILVSVIVKEYFSKVYTLLRVSIYNKNDYKSASSAVYLCYFTL